MFEIYNFYKNLEFPPNAKLSSGHMKTCKYCVVRRC